MVETIIIYGVTLLALYTIVALGFSLMFGVADILNLSHGMIILVSMYLAFQFAGPMGWGLGYSFLGGIISSCVLLFLIYWVFMRRLLTSEHTSMLLLTTGTAYLIQHIIILLFDPSPKSVPVLFSGSKSILGVVVSNQQILTVVVAGAVVLGLSIVLQYTKVGRAIRAVSLDKDTASLYGINPVFVYSITVLIVGLLAGIAGILTAPLQAVLPGVGWTMMITAFTVTILSGLGAPLWGVIVAAAIVSYAELLTAYFISPMLREASAFLIMVLTLMFKPSGLFGRKM